MKTTHIAAIVLTIALCAITAFAGRLALTNVMARQQVDDWEYWARTMVMH